MSYVAPGFMMPQSAAALQQHTAQQAESASLASLATRPVGYGTGTVNTLLGRTALKPAAPAKPGIGTSVLNFLTGQATKYVAPKTVFKDPGSRVLAEPVPVMSTSGFSPTILLVGGAAVVGAMLLMKRKK